MRYRWISVDIRNGFGASPGGLLRFSLTGAGHGRFHDVHPPTENHPAVRTKWGFGAETRAGARRKNLNQPEEFDHRARPRHFAPDSACFVAKRWTGATPTGTIAVIGLDLHQVQVQVQVQAHAAHPTKPPLKRP
jgi:hypothetical protein